MEGTCILAIKILVLCNLAGVLMEVPTIAYVVLYGIQYKLYF